MNNVWSCHHCFELHLAHLESNDDGKIAQNCYQTYYYPCYCFSHNFFFGWKFMYTILVDVLTLLAVALVSISKILYVFDNLQRNPATIG